MGFTKRDVIDYYAAVAPVLLPHLRGRALTVKRYPDGVADKAFYEKQAPRHRPDWVQTASLPSERSGRIDYTLAQDKATLVWLANLAALELHTPLALGEAIERPTTVVFDLDPGAPATIIECCHVGVMLHGMFASLGLHNFAKTSGSKGLATEQRRHVRPDQTVRPTGRRAIRPDRTRPRRLPPGQGTAPRQGPHRLGPKRPTQNHRVRLLAAHP